MKTKKVFLAIITTVVMICSSYDTSTSKTNRVEGLCISATPWTVGGELVIHVNCFVWSGVTCVAWGSGIHQGFWIACWAKPNGNGNGDEIFMKKAQDILNEGGELLVTQREVPPVRREVEMRITPQR